MRAPYGLNILDNCHACPVREKHLFCDLPTRAVQRLNEITAPAIYPAGALLFLEGQVPRGVFVVCTGRVKLLTRSSDGKTLIIRISRSGDVLGLAAVVLDRRYEVTAEMMEPGQANFILRESFMQFVREEPGVVLRVAAELSRSYYSTFEGIRNLGLAASPTERFARLLLCWSDTTAQIDPARPCKLSLTQSEIAELIGTTRETVSRLFARFKEERLLALEGATLVLRDRAALQRIVHC